MFAQIFAVIEIVLKLFGLWEQFGIYMDAKRLKDAEEKSQRRDEAVDNAVKATTPEDAYAAQDGVASNEP